MWGGGGRELAYGAGWGLGVNARDDFTWVALRSCMARELCGGDSCGCVFSMVMFREMDRSIRSVRQGRDFLCFTNSAALAVSLPALARVSWSQSICKAEDKVCVP